MPALAWTLLALAAALGAAPCAQGGFPFPCGGTGGDAENMGSRALQSRRPPLDEKPSANEAQDVMRAWWTVKQSLSLRYLGTTIAMTFLKLYPEHYKHFADDPAEPVERLPQNKRFVGAAVRFIYDLSSMLDHLDDLPLVEALAVQLGQRRGAEGVGAEALEDMRNLILHLVARYHKQYAHMFPLGIVESASHAFNWIFSNLKKGMTM